MIFRRSVPWSRQPRQHLATMITVAVLTLLPGCGMFSGEKAGPEDQAAAQASVDAHFTDDPVEVTEVRVKNLGSTRWQEWTLRPRQAPGTQETLRVEPDRPESVRDARLLTRLSTWRTASR